MGQRSRRRERAAEQPAPPGGSAGPSRGERRAAEVRARLRPLAPGERPGAVTAAAVLAIVLAIGNIVFLIVGVKVGGKQPGAGGVVAFSALMVAAAVGMWRARYWAVLGFEALLAFQIIVTSLALVVASTIAAAAICMAGVGLGGWLFWKLVGVMGRIQAGERARGQSP